MSNFDKTSVSILTQVVFKEMYSKHVDPEEAVGEGFWKAVQANTLELARTIIKVDRQINPNK
jgi:hypothetical protein